MTTCLCVCVYFSTEENAIQFYLYDDDGSTPPVAEMDILYILPDFTVLFGIFDEPGNSNVSLTTQKRFILALYTVKSTKTTLKRKSKLNLFYIFIMLSTYFLVRFPNSPC